MGWGRWTPTTLTYSFASMDSFIDGGIYTFGSDYYDAFDGDADFVADTMLKNLVKAQIIILQLFQT